MSPIPGETSDDGREAKRYDGGGRAAACGGDGEPTAPSGTEGTQEAGGAGAQGNPCPGPAHAHVGEPDHGGGLGVHRRAVRADRRSLSGAARRRGRHRSGLAPGVGGDARAAGARTAAGGRAHLVAFGGRRLPAHRPAGARGQADQGAARLVRGAHLQRGEEVSPGRCRSTALSGRARAAGVRRRADRAAGDPRLPGDRRLATHPRAADSPGGLRDLAQQDDGPGQQGSAGRLQPVGAPRPGGDRRVRRRDPGGARVRSSGQGAQRIPGGGAGSGQQPGSVEDADDPVAVCLRHHAGPGIRDGAHRGRRIGGRRARLVRPARRAAVPVGRSGAR